MEHKIPWFQTTNQLELYHVISTHASGIATSQGTFKKNVSGALGHPKKGRILLSNFQREALWQALNGKHTQNKVI